MKTPLAISDSAIMETANQLFPINVTRLDLIPAGESSRSYNAKQTNGSDLVIKIRHFHDATQGEIMKYLSDYKFKWMPYFIPSVNGNLQERTSDFYFSVHQYIKNDKLYSANSQPGTAHLRELGQALRDLHAIPVDLTRLTNVPRETYQPAKMLEAREALERLLTSPSDTQPMRDVQSLISASLLDIEQLFINSSNYGEQLSATQELSLVVCHGDFHFGNILKPSDDHLYIVDWDEAILALPEFDLKYLSDKQISAVAEGYGGTLPYNTIALRYYRNCLLIRTLWFWITKLLESEADKQDEVADTIIEIFSADSPYMLRALEK